MPETNKQTSTEISTTRYNANRILLKMKYAFYSTLVFFLFANPETLYILQNAFGKFITFITGHGGPTIAGIFVTTGLFFITMLGLMVLPSD